MGCIQEQQALLNPQRQLAKRLGIPCVATNDLHYRDQSDGVEGGPHHILVQARAWRKKEREERSEDRADVGFGKWSGTDGFYLKTRREMEQTGGLMPEELDTTLDILDRVEFDFDKIAKPSHPAALIPEPGTDPVFDRWMGMAA
jgi:DNA polymerase III alpha subunit